MMIDNHSKYLSPINMGLDNNALEIYGDISKEFEE